MLRRKTHEEAIVLSAELSITALRENCVEPRVLHSLLYCQFRKVIDGIRPRAPEKLKHSSRIVAAFATSLGWLEQSSYIWDGRQLPPVAEEQYIVTSKESFTSVRSFAVGSLSRRSFKLVFECSEEFI